MPLSLRVTSVVIGIDGQVATGGQATQGQVRSRQKASKNFPLTDGA